MNLVAGVDVGSTTTKVVIMEGLKILGSKVSATGTNCRRTSASLLESVLDDAGRDRDDVQYVVSTGYGRRMLDFSNEAITEISANVKGASWLMTQCNDSLNGTKIRTLINIGGQDCKVISLDNNGIMKDFVMNDKCAAGTGRFLEVMSCILEVELEQLGTVSLKAKEPLPINSLCTVFGESEVISLLSQGKHVEDIAAGIHRSISKRICAMVRKVGLHEAVFFDGGPALNEGLRFALEQGLRTKVFVPTEPQIVTAIGAAIAANALLKKNTLLLSCTK
ncbi:MAG: acyl-CoA dehydratase activase [Candidatus Brocadiales bacterium]